MIQRFFIFDISCGNEMLCYWATSSIVRISRITRKYCENIFNLRAGLAGYSAD